MMAGGASRVWRLSAERSIELEPWCLMAVLNATPDSFSDGGDHLDPDRAAEAGVQMVRDGAAILDVGGESTRPGADRIAAFDQMARVVPVIESLRRRPETREIPITIDTTLADVAEAALDAGADAINDVSAGEEDPGILRVAAERGVAVILMHRLRPPDRDVYSDRYETPPEYGDVVEDVRAHLERRAAAAIAAGVDPELVAVDPGLGFGKSVEQNLELLRGLPRLVGEGRPVLVGASRKSFLGAIAETPDPRARDLESCVAAVEAWRRGAAILRVHRPGEHRRALRIASAIAGRGVDPADGPSGSGGTAAR